MASITLPLSRLTKGELPPICASSGVPAANVFHMKLGSIDGAIPLNGTVARSISRVQLVCKATFVLTIGLFITGVALQSSLVVQLAAIPLVFAVGLLSAIRSRVPRGSVKGDEVTLHSVHPGFVEACINPPAKCATCPSTGECSVAEMDGCSRAG